MNKRESSMEAKTSLAEKFLNLSPLNLYGYTLIAGAILLSLGALPLLFSESSQKYVLPIVLPVSAILIGSYVCRFYFARNTSSARQKLLEATTTEKAFHIICGGYVWGLGSFAVAAIVFVACLFLFIL